jgi:N-dimethylarginine dimethylaminohydrolase
MKTTHDTGPDALPATYGGETWRPRRASHAEDMGSLWTPCGLPFEAAPLQEVLLARPGEEMALEGEPDEHLMLRLPDLLRMRAQFEALRAFYEAWGVRVHVADPLSRPPPNFVFQRDLFLATPEGVILGRPAALQRAAEAPRAAEVLASLGLPILRSPRGGATFEGADALWAGPDLVLLGVGRRTNEEGADAVTACLGEMGVQTRRFEVPRGVQHLLGILNFADEALAVIDAERCPEALRRWLLDAGFRVLELPSSEELHARKSLNFVPLAPGRVVMNAGCPETRALLEAEGVEVHELDVSEYLAAAGGLGCLTGVLRRGEPPRKPDQVEIVRV